MAAHAAINTITFLTVLATGATADPMEEPQLALGIALLLGGGAATGVLLRGLRRATLAS
jgi:hypothetical protein